MRRLSQLFGGLLLTLLLALPAAQRDSAGLSTLRTAETLTAAGQRTAAAQHYTQALAYLPASPEPALRLAALYCDWQKPAEGQLALAEALRRGAPAAAIRPLHRDFLIQAGDWPALEHTTRAWLTRHPGDVLALAQLTQALLQQHDCPASAESAAQWYALAPHDPRARLTWGVLGRDTVPEVLCSASPLLCSGYRSCENPAQCAALLGQLLLRQEEWALAACVLTQPAQGHAPAEIYAWYGTALERLGLVELARDYYEQAAAIAPAEPLGWLLLGFNALETEDTETALSALQQAHTLDPGNPTPCLGLALAIAQEGRYEAVDTWIEAALERAPEDVEVWKSAARFYLERHLSQGGHPLRAAEGAVRLAPDDAEAWLLLGWAQLQENDPAAALQTLERALALPQAHHLRGLALQRLGRIAEAQEAFTRAADLGYVAP